MCYNIICCGQRVGHTFRLHGWSNGPAEWVLPIVFVASSHRFSPSRGGCSDEADVETMEEGSNSRTRVPQAGFITAPSHTYLLRRGTTQNDPFPGTQSLIQPPTTRVFLWILPGTSVERAALEGFFGVGERKTLSGRLHRGNKRVLVCVSIGRPKFASVRNYSEGDECYSWRPMYCRW
jgi:hypothetical protein